MTERELIEEASREGLLEFISMVIHGYTIMAREPELSDHQRAVINNKIHYLAGQSLGLLRRHDIDDRCRDSIAEHSSLLNPALRPEAVKALQTAKP